MDQAVCAAGGRCVRDLVGCNVSFKNADYLFPSDNVVAELKSLEKDLLSDPSVGEKMHVLYNDWINKGYDVPIIFGEGILRTDQIPAECAQEVIRIFKSRLESAVLRRANRQIRETKTNLDYPSALGLLLLSNEGNFVFDPAMMAHALYHALDAKLPCIEHAIFFSANLVAHSGTAPDGPLFASIAFPNRRQPTGEFLHRLGSSWCKVLSAATGEIFPRFSFSHLSPTEINQLRFRPRP
jgi:hypothetical protein